MPPRDPEPVALQALREMLQAYRLLYAEAMCAARDCMRIVDLASETLGSTSRTRALLRAAGIEEV